MNSYQVFEQLAAVVAYGGGLAAVAAFIEGVRAKRWSSRSARFFTAVLFFIIPAEALLRLLSRPLAEHSTHSLWLQVGLVLIWLAAGAANGFRRLHPREHDGERQDT